MIFANARDVASDLSTYLLKVKGGETVIIADHGHPVAELRPADAVEMAARPFGLCRGEFVVPEDFDSPLLPDLLADFEGS